MTQHQEQQRSVPLGLLSNNCAWSRLERRRVPPSRQQVQSAIREFREVINVHFRIVAFIAVSALLTACGSQSIATPSGQAETTQIRGALHHASGSGGHLYVANFGNSSSSDPGSVTVYALGSTTPELTITQGVSNPGAIVVDSSGTVYVANELGADANTVSEYAAGQTSVLRTISGLNLGYPFNPQGLAFDGSGNLYVAQPNENTCPQAGAIEVYAPGQVAPSRGIKECAPYGLDFDAAGDLYVVTQNYTGHNGTIDEFDPGQTERLHSIKTDVDAPDGMAITPTAIYVTNYGVGSGSSNSGSSIVEYGLGKRSPKVTVSGLSYADVDAVDSSGNVYVADSGNAEVRVFNARLSRQIRILKGSWPDALAFDAAGNLYVSEYGSNTISVYGPGARRPTYTITGLDNPQALAISPF